MIVLGVDPGKRTGLALYDTEARRVLWAANMTVPEALEVLRVGIVWMPTTARHHLHRWGLVAVERMAAQGRGSSDVLRAAEASGMLYEAAGPDEHRMWVTRLEVCRALHVGGKNKDGQIIDRLCEQHGGSRQAAKGRKADPGPLYGVSGDAWQALAVAIVGSQMWEQL